MSLPITVRVIGCGHEQGSSALVSFLVEVIPYSDHSYRVSINRGQQSINIGLGSTIIFFPSTLKLSHEFTHVTQSVCPQFVDCVLTGHQQASLGVYIGYALIHTLTLNVNP